ncbi:LiaI-LiaF-like domain-containing protein [Thermolongibacillus altinsuensis]|uniref:LiaI-LiaF-like domain-containing protein n=1 Tax=Thermolongibacillus altinsuensis TaxID=575256 RepID=UPI00242A3237|nr:DUF5668 domain-containing protein [Thermolongibacillus altinsuensis]GMB07441.1 hypothetical protein B1no1_01510 [Thermolongibacillus altinsuensis]
MKKRGIFSGILLTGFGLYFLFERLSLFPMLHTWPTLLLIIGIALLGQAYIGKEYANILAGIVLVGLGSHFHLITLFPAWPNDISMFVLIIAIGLLFQYQKTKQALLPTILFFLLAAAFLFSNQLKNATNLFTTGIESLLNFWPLAFIVLGLYLLFVKKA